MYISFRGGLKKQLKVTKWTVGGGGGEGVAVNWGEVKCKDTIFCLQRSAYSEYIPSSRGEQNGG